MKDKIQDQIDKIAESYAERFIDDYTSYHSHGSLFRALKQMLKLFAVEVLELLMRDADER